MARSDKLTILQLLPALESGGVERGTLEVAGALALAGHRAIVVSAGGRLVAELEGLGATHLTLPIGRKSPTTLALIPRLRRIIAEHGVDVVHARSRLPAWIAWLALRRMTPRPAFVTTVHGQYSVSRYSAVMTRGDEVVAVSETIRDYVLSHYPGVDREHLHLIHRGVDDDAYPRGYRPDAGWLVRWRESLPELADMHVVTLPGRISRIKGHDHLLDVVARLRGDGVPLHALVVGEGRGGRGGRFARGVVAEVERRGLPVTFLGHRSDVREILAVSDLVLSTSVHPESFGRTVLESLCLGTPVVGYAHGGVGEILGAMYPEGAVEPGDRDALTERVSALLAAPIPVSEGNAFPLERMLAQTLGLYARIAAERA